MENKQSIYRKISAILAISENGVIGAHNNLPWHLPEDFKFFKRTTLGKTVIMGRKTFESMGVPLPKRRNIVITRSLAYHPQGVEVVNSLDQALELSKNDPDVFIIGGSEIFNQAFDRDLIDILYVTLVHADLDGDAVVKLPEDGWEITHIDARQADLHHEFAYTFKTMSRIR